MTSFGAAFAIGLTLQMGQTHVHRYLRPLLARIEQEDIDPPFVISHRFNQSETSGADRLFLRQKEEGTKVVLKP